MISNITEMISLLVGVGGFITALVTTISNRKKTTAEAQNIVADTYGDVIAMLREQGRINAEQITTLMQKDLENQKQIAEYRARETKLQNRIAEMEKELTKLKSYNESNSKVN